MQVWTAELARDKTEVDKGKETVIKETLEIIADLTP